MKQSMTIGHQGVRYVAVGCVLIIIDWVVFVGLSNVGMQAVTANIFGRVAGAAIGFFLNGKVTFGHPHSPRLGFRRFARFAISWILMTTLSTVFVDAIAAQLGLKVAWIAKPIVEIVLAVAAFFVSRQWVYR